MVLKDRTPQTGSNAGILSLYGEGEQMATGSYVSIDVSKDNLDVVMPGEKQTWQVDYTPNGIGRLVKQMADLQPELIVVEATFVAGLVTAVVNPAL